MACPAVARDALSCRRARARPVWPVVVVALAAAERLANHAWLAKVERGHICGLFNVFYVFYAFAIGSPRGMQTKQQGRTNAMPAAPYTLAWAVIC